MVIQEREGGKKPKTVRESLAIGDEVGRIMVPPKDVYIIISRTYDYVILYGKRGFADVIKLRILKWRDSTGLSGWVHCCHRCPWKRSKSEEKEM